MAKKSGSPFGVATKKLDLKPQGKRLEDLYKDKKGKKKKGVKPPPPPRMEQFYKENVIPALVKKFNYSSVMQVPRVEKITLNMGVGLATQDLKLLQAAMNELELIAGQRPSVTCAKQSISNFKLRAGMPIGVKVTLRRARMFEFLDRFINIVSPRIRDFRGFPDKSFDGKGNYTVGVKEQIIFPEINVDKINRITGLDISFVMNAKTDEEAHALLSEFGFPFRKKD